MQLRYIQRDMTYNGGGYTTTQEDTNQKLFEKAVKYAKQWHRAVNQKYDGKDYFDAHIQRVIDYGLVFIYLIPLEYRGAVLAALCLHDVIEDCGKTYNDVKKLFGELTAEIVFACTNDKGRTRKERAGVKYYDGIRTTQFATFVKLCDRLANLSYSKETASSMFKTYKKEHPEFVNALKGTTNIFGKIRFWFKMVFNKFEANYEVLYFELDKLVKIDMTEYKSGISPAT